MTSYDKFVETCVCDAVAGGLKDPYGQPKIDWSEIIDTYQVYFSDMEDTFFVPDTSRGPIGAGIRSYRIDAFVWKRGYALPAGSYPRAWYIFEGYPYRQIGLAKKVTSQPKRKDYCYNCNTDKLYCKMMAFCCSGCHRVILGGA